MTAWNKRREAKVHQRGGRPVVALRWAALPLLACAACSDAGEMLDAELTESELGRGMAFGPSVRVSVSTERAQGDLESTRPGISRDGRVVGFISMATNLVPNDTNGVEDVFVHDRETGRTERVSVSSEGVEGDDFSDRFKPALDRTGRFVAFESGATNLVPGDANATFDIFLRDRSTQTTVRASLGASGGEADGFSTTPAMSQDARYIAFVSAATNLVPGDTNAFQDVFVRDRSLGTTSRVSIATDGSQGNDDVFSDVAISDDGRFVAFSSGATNLTPEGVSGSFVRDRRRGTTTLVTVSSAEVPGGLGGSNVAGSADGRFVVFDSASTNLVPNDTNGLPDVFVRDIVKGRTERVSVSSRAAEANGASGFADISDDGRFVAFGSAATNLVPGASPGSIYVHDRQTRTTRLVTRTFDGNPPDFASGQPVLSGDARVIALQSLASNLVPNDTNGVTDVFVQDVFLGPRHGPRH